MPEKDGSGEGKKGTEAGRGKLNGGAMEAASVWLEARTDRGAGREWLKEER